MTEFDWGSIDRAKALQRKHSAQLPFEEKLRILDRLRERDGLLRALRQQYSVFRSAEPNQSLTVFGTEPRRQWPVGTLRLVSFGAGDTLVIAATGGPVVPASSYATVGANATMVLGLARPNANEEPQGD